MKVIDLLNKIANGEKVPKKLIYRKKTFIFDNRCRDYFNSLTNTWLFDNFSISGIINDKVEIIKEDKKIEKLYELNNESDESKRLRNKINEIIDVLNKE